MITLDRDQKEHRIHGKSQGSYFTELLFYLLDKKLEKALPVDYKISYTIQDKSKHALELLIRPGFSCNLVNPKSRDAF